MLPAVFWTGTRDILPEEVDRRRGESHSEGGAKSCMLRHLKIYNFYLFIEAVMHHIALKCYVSLAEALFATFVELLGTSFLFEVEDAYTGYF